MSNTANLDLERPDLGAADWHTSLNSNFTKLDTGYGNNVSSIADLPEVYIETGTFNYTTGDVISLPKSVDATNEYNVTITPTSRAGAIGDIYVTKTTSNFTVYCSSNNTTDTFAAAIYYIGDVSSYGGSIYRRWYVSTDASITDHGDNSDTGSLAWVLSQIGASPATVELPGNKTYNLVSYDVTFNANIAVVMQGGAVIDGSRTVTFYSPGQIITNSGGNSGEIFGSSLTVTFSSAGKVYPVWFGVDDTGTSDSATELQAAVDSLSVGGKIDFGGKDYRIDSTIDLDSNITLEGNGCTIDFSNASSGDYLFDVRGSAATARSLTSNADQGDSSIDISSAGSYYSVDDWTYVKDDTEWGTSTGVQFGEWVHIKTVNANSVDLGAVLLYDYTTAQNATLEVITFKENINIRGIRATANEDGEFFFYSRYCKNINIENCTIDKFEGRGIRTDQSIQIYISNNEILRSNDSSTGYGVAMVACANGVIHNNYFEECRHAVSIGGAEIPTRFVTISNNKVQSPMDAGLDCHNASDYITFCNNMIHGGASSGTTSDGIIYQGANATIINNTIVDVGENGIFIDNVIDETDITTSYIINDNYIERAGLDGAGQGSGIYVGFGVSNGERPVKGLIIKGNVIKTTSDNGIFVYLRSGDIDDVIISNNTIEGITLASQYCIWIYALTGHSSTGGVVSNNICNRGDDLAANIRIQSVDASGITYYSIVGNIINNGTYGVRAINTDYMTVIGNSARGTANTGFSVDGSNNEEANNIG